MEKFYSLLLRSITSANWTLDLIVGAPYTDVYMGHWVLFLISMNRARIVIMQTSRSLRTNAAVGLSRGKICVMV